MDVLFHSFLVVDLDDSESLLSFIKLKLSVIFYFTFTFEME